MFECQKNTKSGQNSTKKFHYLQMLYAKGVPYK